MSTVSQKACFKILSTFCLKVTSWPNNDQGLLWSHLFYLFDWLSVEDDITNSWSVGKAAEIKELVQQGVSLSTPPNSSFRLRNATVISKSYWRHYLLSGEVDALEGVGILLDYEDHDTLQISDVVACVGSLVVELLGPEVAYKIENFLLGTKLHFEFLSRHPSNAQTPPTEKEKPKSRKITYIQRS